jgi:benzodiazapine receptor
MSVSSSAVRPETADRLRSALVLLAFLVVSTAIVSLGSALAQPHYFGWYAQAEKAPWAVAPWVSGSIWSLLHIAMSVAAWLVWLERRNRHTSGALSLYGTQLLLNALWRPVLFMFYPRFGDPAIWLAAAILVLMIVTVSAAYVEFRRVSKVAALLVLPYLAWLGYILSLNIALGVLN